MKWICLNYLSRKAPGGFNQLIHLFQRKVKNVHSQTECRSFGLLLWMLSIWNSGFPNKGPSSLSSLITNESAFSFWIPCAKQVNRKPFILFFFCPAGRWWVIVAESAPLQRSCCSGLCPTPFPAPHLSLYFHKHVKLNGCWCQESPAYCKPILSILEIETVGLLFFSWLYCNLTDTHNGECCCCCLCSVSLCIAVNNSRILLIKPIRSFLFWCSATKGPKCSPGLDLFTCTSVQPFINQWTPVCPQTYNGTVSEDMDGQKGLFWGLFWIISNFSAVELPVFVVLRQFKGAVLNVGPVFVSGLSAV